MNTGESCCKNHSGKTCDSGKPSSEPPERMFIPPESEPPERKQVPPERGFVECSFILDTTEFTSILFRQSSPKEDISVGTLFNVFQIIKQIIATNALYGSFQAVGALNNRCWTSSHAPPLGGDAVTRAIK